MQISPKPSTIGADDGNGCLTALVSGPADDIVRSLLEKRRKHNQLRQRSTLLGSSNRSKIECADHRRTVHNPNHSYSSRLPLQSLSAMEPEAEIVVSDRGGVHRRC